MSHSGNNSLAINIASPYDNCGAFQYLDAANSPDTFVWSIQPLALTISGWSYTEDMTGLSLCAQQGLTDTTTTTTIGNIDNAYGIGVELRFADGSVIEDQMLSFDPTIDRKWQHQCLVLHTSRHNLDPLHRNPLTSISIFIIFRGPHTGKVYIDDIELWTTTG